MDAFMRKMCENLAKCVKVDMPVAISKLKRKLELT